MTLGAGSRIHGARSGAGLPDPKGYASPYTKLRGRFIVR
jgi:hypothetical protein